MHSFPDLMKAPRRLGIAVIVVFFGVFGGWAAATPLSSAAVAPGVVSPDGSRKTVQHLEGGIIRTIHVREGDRVAVGAPLVSLQDTSARAEYRELVERLVHLMAEDARLVAEQAGDETLPALRIDSGLLAEMDRGDVERVFKGQRDLLLSRRATLQGRTQILRQRVRQLDEEITGLREVIAAQEVQLGLISREEAGVQELYSKGLERLPRLLALQRERAAIQAEQAKARAGVAQKGQQIGETEIQLLTLTEQFHEQINQRSTEIRSELARLHSILPARRDALTRTTVTAPLSGTVMNVMVTTASGVVRPGEPLLDIVPDDDALVIDARVRPIDIDVVSPGQRTRVMLNAFRQRNMPQIFGTLRSISPDRLVDERTGEPYFLAKVDVDPAELAALDGGLHISPGMPVDVMILTGERTMVDYLLRPFLDSVLKSFREA